MDNYVLMDGKAVTRTEIEKAFAEGKAVLVHYRLEGRTGTCLMLDGKHFDTRGECYSAWEEKWTQKPKHVGEALKAAKT